VRIKIKYVRVYVKGIMFRILLPGDENNKDGNTYLYYDREGCKEKKMYLGISRKGTKLDFAKHA
jgi:hypothetical protein